MGNEERVRQQILGYLDTRREEMVWLLSELIRIRSVFPPGEYEAIAQRMQQEFEQLGLKTAAICAPRDKVERAGLRYPRPNVVSLLPGSEAKPVLMIGTHMDVVEAEDAAEWRFDPFAGVVSDGKVWGRGACDAKCTLVAQVFVAKTLVECGVRLKGSLLCVGSVDDEGRFDHLKWPGTAYLAEEGLQASGFPLPDMVINGEASGLSSICGSFKGRLILEIPVLGETAHAATPFGVNAINKAIQLIQALERIELLESPLQGRETFNICAMEGRANRYGDIPPTCNVGCEIRVVAPYSTARIRAEIDRVISDLRASDPEFRVGPIRIFSDRQPIEIPSDGLLVRSIAESARSVGVDARYSAILGTGELQAFVARGIPGVTYGPGSIDRVHKKDEYLEIEDLVNQAKIYTLAAMNACEVQS